MRPKKIVLCVDDDEQALAVLKFTLGCHKYRVLTATNGPDVIATFVGIQVDLVLTDHLMPGMCGDELILKLKTIKSHVPMILLGDPAKIGMAHAADSVLEKKIPMAELLERIKVMCARKRGPRRGTPRPGNARKRAAAVYAAIAAGIEG